MSTSVHSKGESNVLIAAIIILLVWVVIVCLLNAAFTNEN